MRIYESGFFKEEGLYLQQSLACVASVPIPHERNWGRAKEIFRIQAARKMRREQKSGRRGVGEGKGEKERTLARKPLDFEKRPLVFTVEFIY